MKWEVGLKLSDFVKSEDSVKAPDLVNAVENEKEMELVKSSVGDGWNPSKTIVS